MQNRPIGIFDSGVGGLTVVKEVFKGLPNEEIVYLGDTARVPYGTKSSDTIKRFSIENVEFLMRFNVKLIVVACNTVSSISLPVLRMKFKIPIIGVIRAGAKKAVAITKNNKIGVIGTSTTIKSKAYDSEIERVSDKVKVFSQACPLFVPLAEEGMFDGDITFAVAKEYLLPLAKNGIDTVILGCTHYPLLTAVISKALGKDVNIVDSASSVAEEVVEILQKNNELNDDKVQPSHSFFVTDETDQFLKIGEGFLGTKIDKVRRADYV